MCWFGQGVLWAGSAWLILRFLDLNSHSAGENSIIYMMVFSPRGHICGKEVRLGDMLVRAGREVKLAGSQLRVTRASDF